MKYETYEKLNPFPKEGFIYGKVSDYEIYDGDIDKGCSFSIDIINDNMINYDKQLFEGNEDYLDMFFYFMIIDTNDKRIIRKLMERVGKEYYIFKIKEHKGDINYNNSPELLIGEIYFCASPMKVKKYIIEITGQTSGYEEVKLPEDIYIDDRMELQKIIEENFRLSQKEIKSLKINHVGEGHNSYFELNTGERISFDLGYTRCHNKDKSHVRSSFEFQKYNGVFLSHWDVDHYLAITLSKSKEVLSVPWIAPSQADGCNLKRLCYLIYIYSHKRIFLVENSISGQIYSNNWLSILKGNGKEKNNSGLVLFIRSSKKVVSLGDLGYEYLDLAQLPFLDVDYLVVPHHGAVVKGSNPFTGKIGAKAIIPVGYNPINYNHPRKETIMELKDNGFEIHRTDWHGEIRINF